MIRKPIILFLLAIAVVISACSNSGNRFTDQEADLILSGSPTETMRLFTIDNLDDSLLLRSASEDVSPEMFDTDTYRRLVSRLLATVNDPAQPGVGIAAPQVGILRRVIAVQRYDKDGKPFEIYVNPVILSYSDSVKAGPEGCLSVPGGRGQVTRPTAITLRYIDGDTFETRQEDVQGFTAVIFQHEIDHLSGRLYIDYLP